MLRTERRSYPSRGLASGPLCLRFQGACSSIVDRSYTFDIRLVTGTELTPPFADCCKVKLYVSGCEQSTELQVGYAEHAPEDQVA